MSGDLTTPVLEQGSIYPPETAVTQPPAPEQIEQEPGSETDVILKVTDRIIKRMRDFDAEPNKPPYDLSLNEDRSATGLVRRSPVSLRLEQRIERIFPKKGEEGGPRDIVTEDSLRIWSRRTGREVSVTRKPGEIPTLLVHDADGDVYFEFGTDYSKEVPEKTWKKTRTSGRPFNGDDKKALTYAVNLFSRIFISSLRPDVSVKSQRMPFPRRRLGRR